MRAWPRRPGSPRSITVSELLSDGGISTDTPVLSRISCRVFPFGPITYLCWAFLTSTAIVVAFFFCNTTDGCENLQFINRNLKTQAFSVQHPFSILANLLIIDLLDQSHSKGHLLFLPSDDYLRLVHTRRRNIDACACLLHHFSYQLVEGTSDEWMVHFLNVHPLNSTLVLKVQTLNTWQRTMN